MHNLIIPAYQMIYILVVLWIYTGLLIFFIDVILSYKMKNENQRNSLKSIWKLNDELSEKNKRLEEIINKQQIIINERIIDISDLNNKIEEKKKQINTLYTKQAYLKAKNIAFYIALKRIKWKDWKTFFENFMKGVYELQRLWFKKLEEIKIELDKNKK